MRLRPRQRPCWRPAASTTAVTPWQSPPTPCGFTHGRGLAGVRHCSLTAMSRSSVLESPPVMDPFHGHCARHNYNFPVWPPASHTNHLCPLITDAQPTRKLCKGHVFAGSPPVDEVVASLQSPEASSVVAGGRLCWLRPCWLSPPTCCPLCPSVLASPLLPPCALSRAPT